MSDKIREAFEKFHAEHLRKLGLDESDIATETDRLENGDYQWSMAADAWPYWKAALTQQPAPEAQKPAAWEVSSFGGRVDRIVVREDVAQELASKLIQRDAKDVRVRPLYAAPPAAEQPDSARSILTDEDMRRLRRFQEICEDSDACGHDLPKEAVKRLERAGALRSCGFGRHEVTAFGDYLLTGGRTI